MLENQNIATNNQGLQKFYAGVYAYMTLGLVISGLSAYVFIYSNNFLSDLLFEFMLNIPYAIFGFMAIEVGLVFSLRYTGSLVRGTIQSIGLFIVHATVSGITLGLITWIYTPVSVVNAFVSTAAMFGVLSMVGLVVKKDLTRVGHAAFSALIGIFVASLVNIFFLRSESGDFLISILVVLIFSVLTAYDTQKLKRIYTAHADTEKLSTLVIISALELYLDFVNIFIAVLRIFGKRK